jgi:hypothetical protein
MALADTLAQFTTDANAFNQMVHGTSSQLVSTENGQVRSLAKAIADADAAAAAAEAVRQSNYLAGQASRISDYLTTQATMTAVQTKTATAIQQAQSGSALAQLDLSAISGALHRSPNAVNGFFVYDTSKDSDGGAWTQTCDRASWSQEQLMGNWLPSPYSGYVTYRSTTPEMWARCYGATLGAEQVAAGMLNSSYWTGYGQNKVVNDDGGIRIGYIDNGSGAYIYLSQSRATPSLTTDLTVNQLYKFTAQVRVSTGGYAIINITYAGGSGAEAVTSTTYRTVEFVFPAESASSMFLNIGAGVGSSTWIKNISIRPVVALNTRFGDYYQNGSDGKFYRLNTNLLTFSDQFDNSVWVKQFGLTVSANSTTAPDGTQTADKLIEGTSAGAAYTVSYASYTFLGGQQYTFSVYLKAGERTRALIGFNTASANSPGFIVDLNAGTVVETRGIASAVMVNAGNGWWKLIATWTVSGPIFSSSFNFGPTANTTSFSSTTGYTGNGSSGIYAWGAQLEFGSSASAYQQKTTDAGVTEVFRGNNKNFPRIAGLVVEATRLTIYDLMQPGRPMWMSFIANGTTVGLTSMMGRTGLNKSCVAAAQGRVYVGSSSSAAEVLTQIDFVGDRAFNHGSSYQIQYGGNIAQRNSLLAWLYNTTTIPAIGGNYIANAIALCTMTDAPTDPSTGLQIPTVAVGLGNGVSVIKHDGTVVTNTMSSITTVAFDYRKRLSITGSTGGIYSVRTYDADFTTVLTDYSNMTYTAYPVVAGSTGAVSRGVPGGKLFSALCSAAGQTLSLILPNPSNKSLSAVAYIDKNYTTGWQFGDIRRTLLTETHAMTQVGTELCANGGFDTTSTWINDGTWTISGGVATNNGNGTLKQSALLPINVGDVIRVTFTLVSKASGFIYPWVAGQLQAYTGIGISYGQSAVGTYSIDIPVVNVTDQTIGFITGNSPLSLVIDNVSFKKVTSASNTTFGGELITNGTFDTNTNGWFGDSVANSTLSSVSGQLRVTNANGTTGSLANFGFPTVPGTTYRFYFEQPSGTATAVQFMIGLTPGGIEYTYFNLTANTVPTGSGQSATFVATGTWAFVCVKTNNTGLGSYSNWDNISVKPIVIDRSYKSFSTPHYLNVVGTVTKSQVGNNSQLLSYSGFSNSNYLQETAHSTDLDFGTGNVRMDAWFNIPTNAQFYQNLATKSNLFGSGSNWNIDGITVTDGDTTVNGVSYARLQQPATTTGNNRIYWLHPNTAIGQTPQYNVSFRVHRVVGSTDRLVISFRSGSAVYDPVTQAFTSGGTGWTITVIDADTVRLSLVAIKDVNGSSGVNILQVARASDGALFGGGTGGVHIAQMQFTMGPALLPYEDVPGTVTVRCHPIAEYSYSSGAYYTFGFGGDALPMIEVFDGTTKRTASMNAWSSNVVGINCLAGSWQKLTGELTGSTGTLVIRLNGQQMAQATGSALLTLTNSNAVLTVGNNYALNSPFPGSIALVKIGGSIPFTEQNSLMYLQEQQMFQDGAQVSLPDSATINELEYDPKEDCYRVVTNNYESRIVGLVRTSTATNGNGGNITKVVQKSGVRLLARNTGGIDISTNTLTIAEELRTNKAEAAWGNSRPTKSFDFDATTGQTDFVLPDGWETLEVISAGASKREGSTKDWIRLWDGFKEIIRFGVSPGNGTWVQIIARKVPTAIN